MTSAARPDAEQVRRALRTVIDPENAVNIVDLGLVYAITITDDRVHVAMTMTSPACPMGDLIVEDVEAVLKEILPAGFQPDVELVWEPPWSPSLMSDAARQTFGW